MRWKRWLGLLLVVVGAGGLLGAARFDVLVLQAVTPREPFDAGAAPPAPDYADAASWSALPGREDAADAFLAELPAGAQTGARVDVFYVHPTTYVGARWNAPVNDARLNADTDRVATRLQASAFNAIGAVYAPRYRQANMTAFSHPTAEGQRALDVAYADVRAAFRRFHEVRGAGRPFLIAAHSQGSMLAYRLLREEVSRTALREALVAAWIIGGAIGEEDVREQLPDIPPCAGPEQVGCIIAWNARAPGYQTGPFEMRVRVREGHPLGTLLCVNPLSGRHDGVAVEAERNRGAVFFDTEPALFLPGFTGAACREGLLEVVPVGQVPRDFMSTLLDRALGPGNYHPVEYQLFFADIRHNARVRLDAWSRSR